MDQAYRCPLSFIYERVLKGEIGLRYVITKEQAADLFTKSLPSQKLVQFCNILGMNEAIVEREY